jgi:hypothetical protein
MNRNNNNNLQKILFLRKGILKESGARYGEGAV